ncbi:hypothetical protein BG006_003051 [Podila minutissima]|uniref:Amino acid transporter transmembrane domain-containing protein n=1 Tax=Podila minutissima TaxID=64525 RepID=A0A9P5SMQ3_9FUNG|nr:hypothetical protein BG006_003051 [Podila minutissima]
MLSTMGATGFYLLNSVVFFQTAGAAITYLIVIGDTIPVILGLLGFPIARRWVIFVCSLAFVLPLLFFRSIGSLARVSIISVMTLPPILFAVAFSGFQYAPDHKRSFDFVGDNVFPAIGVMAFAMLSTQTAFMNYQTLANPSKRAWAQATGIAVSLSWAISFVFAIIGFISFGEDVMPNIFNSFPLTDELINYGRGLLGFSMFLTFPQAFYPARAALHKVLGHEDAHSLPSDTEHVLTTLGLFIPILVCGVFIADLGLLYQLIGGFCSTFLAYIIPGLCYFFVFWADKSQSYAFIATLGEDEDNDEHGQEGFDDNSDEEDSGHNTQSIGRKKVALEKHTRSQVERGQVSIGDNDNEGQILLPFSHITHHSHSHTHHTSSYGATTTVIAPLGLDSSISSAEIGTAGNRARRRRLSTVGKRPRKTELWLDVGAGILLVFGVFVMVISTATTLKKMAGYA